MFSKERAKKISDAVEHLSKMVYQDQCERFFTNFVDVDEAKEKLEELLTEEEDHG